MKRRRLRKLPCLIIAMIIVLLINLISGGFAAKASGQESARELQAVQVASGDTLWTLVEEYYLYEGDIRKAIYEVQQINALEGGIIQPGQIIYIPEG